MANLLESYGLEFFEENDETMTGLVGYVVSKGKAISSYYGAPYLYMPVGAPEFWAGSETDSEGKLHINSFHTHCGGRNIWEMICSDIDLSPKVCPKNERILMMSRSTEEGCSRLILSTQTFFPVISKEIGSIFRLLLRVWL